MKTGRKRREVFLKWLYSILKVVAVLSMFIVLLFGFLCISITYQQTSSLKTCLQCPLGKNVTMADSLQDTAGLHVMKNGNASVRHKKKGFSIVSDKKSVVMDKMNVGHQNLKGTVAGVRDETRMAHLDGEKVTPALAKGEEVLIVRKSVRNARKIPTTRLQLEQAHDLEDDSKLFEGEKRCSSMRDNRGYFLSMDYQYQLSGSIFWFSLMAGVANHLRKEVVEPFVLSSQLWGVPPLSHSPFPVHRLPRFGEFFDKASAEKSLEECLVTPAGFRLRSWKEFIFCAEEKAIVVQFLKSEQYAMSTRNASLPITDCTLSAYTSFIFSQKIKKRFSKVLKTNRKFSLRLVKSVCVNAMFEIDMKTLSKWIPEGNFTILIHIDQRPILKIPTKCKQESQGYGDLEECCHFLTWSPAREILLTAERLLSSQVVRPFLAVHVRAERLLRYSRKDGIKMDPASCMKRLNAAIGVISNVYALETRQKFLFHDTGEFGTGTCQGKCHSQSRSLLGLLSQSNLSRLEYNTSSIGGAITWGLGLHPDRTAMAFVEREVMARADFLFLVGGGHFQQSILEVFNRKHEVDSADRWFSWCSPVVGSKMKAVYEGN